MKLIDVLVGVGALGLQQVAELSRWVGTNLVTSDVLEHSTKRLEEVLAERSVVLVKETDLDAMSSFSKTLQSASLTIAGDSNPIAVYVGTTNLGDYLIPCVQTGEDSQLSVELLEEAILVVSGKTVQLTNVRLLSYGSVDVFLVGTPREVQNERTDQAGS